jgi:beta-glucosidase
MSYHEQRWPPEQGSKFATLVVMLNLAAAHRKSYKIITRATSAHVGLAHNCAYYYAGDDSIISRVTAYISNKFANEFFINRVKRQQDFFGLNYYFANRIIGTRVHNPNEKLSDLGWDMQPELCRPLMQQLYKKYKKPIIITENGVADMHDTYRKWWISKTVQAMDGAIKDGVDVRGYIHWSLLDNFEWAEGFWPRFGLVEIDYKTLARKVRPSAQWYARLIKTIKK